MSEWTPPEGATPQDFPGQPKDGVAAIVQRTRDVALEMRDRFNNLLKSAGIRVEPGKLIIEGDLEVPNGAIKNAYLESPLSPGVGSFGETGFGLTTTRVARATGTIAVPAGYTQALLFMFAFAGAYNDTTDPDYLTVEAVVNGVGSRDMAQRAAGLTWATGNTGCAKILTDLTAPISIGINVWSAFGTWSADATNRASCEALAIFLR